MKELIFRDFRDFFKLLIYFSIPRKGRYILV